MSGQLNVGPIEPEISPRNGEPERTCWICFATETENRHATWLHPCQCRGSTKWVHESCLFRWIDEKQNGNSRMRVSCMQCRVEYLIIFPKVSRVAIVLESCQDLIRQCSPFIAVSAVLCSIYWTAVSYGGITILQAFGQQRGMELLEKGDPIFLLIGLPLIPVALILTRFIRWEEAVLRFWHNRHGIVRKLPFINWLCDGTADGGDLATPIQPPDEPIDFARIFCGAIILPSVATLLGNIIYRQLATPLHRTLLGGLTFIGIKGMLKIYLRQKQYLNKSRRHVVDYTEANIINYTSNQSQSDRSMASLRQNAGFQNDGDNLERVEMQTVRSTSSATSTITTSQADSDTDDTDFQDRVIISVPDRPFTLFF